MQSAKHIQPGTKVGLKLTTAERRLILDDLMSLDDNYAEAIRETPADQPVKFTLDEWEDFGGYIAAEANHTQDKKLGKKLDAIFNKVQKILDTYTDEEPPKTVKIEDARKAKVLSDQALEITQWVAKVLVGAEQLDIKNKPLKTLLAFTRTTGRSAACTWHLNGDQGQAGEEGNVFHFGGSRRDGDGSRRRPFGW